MIKLRDYVMQYNPPEYHYKHNIVEGFAICALLPAQWEIALFENPMEEICQFGWKWQQKLQH